MNIGAKIKRIRLTNQLTLEELANRSELTKGFLSQVERNLTSPSITTLEDILEALGTNLNEFFSEKDEEQIVFKEEDYFINEQEGYSISYIVPNAQKNDMEPILIEIEKDGCSMIIEPTEGEEFGYVLEGTVELHYGTKELIVNQGETFYLLCQQTHYLKNVGKKEAKVVWVATPPLF